MPTPVSSLSSYCSAEQFLSLYDWRSIAQLMSDANVDTAQRATLLDTSSLEGGRLNDILMGSSGEVETAALVGGKYSPTDLQALTGNQAKYLQRIVADLSIGRCYQRRPDLAAPVPTQTQVAQNVLNALASGERIFGLQENIDASVLQHVDDRPQDVIDRKGKVWRASGYFGTTNNRRT